MVLSLRPGRVQKKERTVGADLTLREKCANAGIELGPEGREFRTKILLPDQEHRKRS